MIQRRRFMLSAAALAVAATLPLTAAAESPAKVGFVYVSPIGDAGWTYQHDEGRKQMEKALGSKIETRYVESVAEGADAERVIREFAASGSQIVFATSFGYMNYVERVARRNMAQTRATRTGSGGNAAAKNREEAPATSAARAQTETAGSAAGAASRSEGETATGTETPKTGPANRRTASEKPTRPDPAPAKADATAIWRSLFAVGD